MSPRWRCRTAPSCSPERCSHRNSSRSTRSDSQASARLQAGRRHTSRCWPQRSGVPMLVAAGEQVLGIPDGSQLILDADSGSLQVSPASAALKEAEQVVASRRLQRARDQQNASTDCRMADGTRIEVFANAASVAEAQAAVAQGAEGCGLLRTEFLFLDRATAPDEDTQATGYQRNRFGVRWPPGRHSNARRRRRQTPRLSRNASRRKSLARCTRDSREFAEPAATENYSFAPSFEFVRLRRAAFCCPWSPTLPKCGRRGRCSMRYEAS